MLGAVAGFVAGYLSPTPDDIDDPEEPLPVDDDGYVDDGNEDGAGAGERDESAPAAVGDEAPWWRSR